MLRCMIPILLDCVVAIFLLSVPQPNVAEGQNAAQKPEEKPANKQSEKPPTVEATENPAQIELLETRYRFEANGDSRKEVHTRVKINNELGARQFARLNFDYNRSFEQIEIPLVQITHASGGTAEILPGAITDNPNPAVVNAPAYQDVRVKTARVLGLEPSDSLEYRVITTVSHHPLAPDFWLDHTFDRTGVVSREIFELDLPASVVPGPEIRINPATPASSSEESGGGDASRVIYRWDVAANSLSATHESHFKDSSAIEPDVVLSTANWLSLSIRLGGSLSLGSKKKGSMESLQEASEAVARMRQNINPEVAAKAGELTRGIRTTHALVLALYDFVSQKIKTVDLPLGSTGYAGRPANEILASGYATQEDKFVLFAALAAAAKLGAEAGLAGYCDEHAPARPSAFRHLLVRAGDGKGYQPWADPSLEVAPFGLVPSNSGKCIFVIESGFIYLNSTGHEWEKLETEPPFPSSQRVSINAFLGSDGMLTAKVHYAMRGQNELLLRVAFHQTPKEKWKDVAQLLALSDGFRGQVTSVTASDPYATREPFTVEYEVTQPKFVDWSKKPVRIPAVLPLVGLPDPPAKSAPGAAASPIDLGTPLDIQTRVTLHLPSGTTATAPTATSVQRDYASFSSSYSAQGATIFASRHLHFLLREVPAARAADYTAFVRAVQTDETQQFTLERAETPSPKTNSAAPSEATPPKPNSSKP
jgi:Domain of Unknown Function with PDB structure (DUF3857)